MHQDFIHKVFFLIRKQLAEIMYYRVVLGYLSIEDFNSLKRYPLEWLILLYIVVNICNYHDLQGSGMYKTIFYIIYMYMYMYMYIPLNVI